MKFLSLHTNDVGSLARAIYDCYAGQIQVKLTGKLSERASFFLDSLCIESEMELEYVGTWITAAEARFVKIKSAAERIAPRQKADKHRQLGEHYDYGEFFETLWSQETNWIYAKLADENEEEAVFRDLKLLAEFSINKETNTLCMDPCRSLRRELQHNIAQDLGFKTSSQGDRSTRQVVVWKI